jgi:hypothetical protein
MDNQPTPQNANTSTDRIELWGRTRLGLLVLGVLSLSVFGKMCGHRRIENNVPGQGITIKNPSKLKVLLPHIPLVQQPKVIDRYVPPEGSVTITPVNPSKSIDDLVKIYYQTIGWTFEPGIQTLLLQEPNLGLDAKIFYAYRFGLNVGFVAGPGLNLGITPDVSVSYRLDQVHLRNTEVFVGYVPLTSIAFQMGFRINL